MDVLKGGEALEGSEAVLQLHAGTVKRQD